MLTSLSSDGLMTMLPFAPFATPFALLLGLLCMAVADRVAGQDFRIEEIHAPGSSAPVAQNLTLFNGQMIYDFQLSGDLPPETLEVVI